MPKDIELKAKARARLGWFWRRVRGLPATAPGSPPVFYDADEIGHIQQVYAQHGAAEGSPWDAYRDAHMRLPGWFRHGLDPWGDAYRQQQLRLWRLIADVDRDYVPETDEVEVGWDETDAVRQPGYYRRRDPAAITTAGDHWLATGMLLKHCGLQPGDRALEYGPGFGQSALALARMGVEVDTVDISATFCRFVQQQAEFFKVPLYAHQGRFGLHPRPGERYKLIWFYESFHHCLDFQPLVTQMAAMLAEDGRIILGGEPIVEREYAAVPYPWGIRLHSEVAAVMRQTRWMEIGFSEAFLVELFARAGFSGKRIDCDSSLFGRLYVFERSHFQMQK